jgi:5-methyltetrahydrofolate--homocysteine methyltransferase
MKYGLGIGQCPEEINIKNPVMLEKIHKEYVEAGAKILQTNTFGANRIKLGKYGLENRIKEIIFEGVKIAKDVGCDTAWVGLSVGPTGELMRPYGEMSFNQLINIYEEQIEIAVEAGIDFVCIETMGDMGELKAAFLAAKKYKLPVSCSVTFGKNGCTLMGTNPLIYAKTLSKWGSDIAAANCSSPKQILSIIEILINNFNGPCGVRPNAGEPVIKDGKTIYPMSAKKFNEYGREFKKKGISIIGGCCGTMPEHIRLLNEDFTDKKKVEMQPINNFITSSRQYLDTDKDFDYHKIRINENVDFNKLLSSISSFSSEKESALLLEIDSVSINHVDKIIEYVQAYTRKPLIFKSDDNDILKKALKTYNGAAGVVKNKNSIEKILAEYGGQLIILE